MSSMGAASAERLAVGLNLNDFGKDASQAIFWDSHADPVLESRNVGLISACPRWNGRTQHMILSPRIPYRPTAGLAFLFSRSGTSSSATRAVHISSRGVAAGTFVEAVRNAMAPVGDTGGRGGSRGQHQSEGAGGFSTGHQQLGGTGGHVAGMGLNTDFGRGGSQPVFHPGYGGGGRPFGRRGGGQGCAGAWRGGRGASAGGRFYGGRTLPIQSRGGGVHSRFTNGGASSVMVAGQGLGGSGASSVTPQVSNAVDLLQQAITTSIGNGSVVRPVPDSTVEQIVSLLQQSVGKSQHIQNSSGNPAGAVNKVSDSMLNSNTTSGKSVCAGHTQLDLEQSQGTSLSVNAVSIEKLGSIPEALSGTVQALRRSSRRSDSVSEDSLVRAVRLKAGYNLDDQPTKAGSNPSLVASSIGQLKKLEINRVQDQLVGKNKAELSDFMGKGVVEDEEFDHFILNHLCGDIMNEETDGTDGLIKSVCTKPSSQGSLCSNKKGRA
ncbi:hypothetical protein ZEAMMB73_Zm00001d023354 [Zea mays]|uniref:Uncharacterized protein n=1 Tax=Zea mays TaxID=4577 RepID=A0A1D6ISZ5_MAIZE|nr:hypothetical protein ZEAMMB73_Zm00001d023354 [Zea mays]